MCAVFLHAGAEWTISASNDSSSTDDASDMHPVIKRAVGSLADRLGYTLAPTWRLDRLPMARHLQKLFALAKVDLVLDVGANAGQYHDFLRTEVGYRGPIVSFEPNPALSAPLIVRAEEDPRWWIESYALGAESGSLVFNVMANSEFSSFLAPSNRATTQFKAMNRVADQIVVEVRRLDDCLPAILEKCNALHTYLKLDTQGYDLEVVRGAAGVLDRIDAMQLEASVTPIYEHAPDFATAIDVLRSQKFEPSGFFPNNEGQFPRLVEFDCVMISSRYLS